MDPKVFAISKAQPPSRLVSTPLAPGTLILSVNAAFSSEPSLSNLVFMCNWVPQLALLASSPRAAATGRVLARIPISKES